MGHIKPHHRHRRTYRMTALTTVLALLIPMMSLAQTPATPQPWMTPGLDADTRADSVVKAMTQDEKLTLVFGYFSTKAPWMKNQEYPKDGLPDSAGFVPGVPRLGIPNQWQTDAGVGVATQTSQTPRLRTSLPSGLATAATWSPEIAYAGGAMIGNEARLSGFNVQLAGGVNLTRDARNGRNFEYGGEDPLLAGTIVGQEIKGIQSNHIISTLKHYAFNDIESNRNTVDVAIDDQAGRQSDLLAFQFAYETGQPGSVMCSYNRVNGAYACESDYLLNKVLKTGFGFKGYVMSDWGATHSTIPAVTAGLDQQSGWAFDKSPYFTGALKEAVNDGWIAPARLDDMAHRILRSMFANGLIDDPVQGDRSTTIDYAAHARVTQSDAEDAIVLLKNAGNVLPLAHSAKRIAIISGHADIGVLSGGGSSQVYPYGAPESGRIIPDEYGKGFPGPMVYDPSSPLKGIATRSTAKLTYADGKDVAAAAKLAAHSDIVIVFATQWLGESLDAPSLSLPGDQDALIAAIAKANPRTVVVLETGGPVAMPWLNKVGAVLETWYPGSSGGEAIARVLTGEVNPSGHLPATFPASEAQLPRPQVDTAKDLHPLISYKIEGAAIGYKWFDLKGLKPLFPFGYGQSYTSFALSDVQTAKASGGDNLTVTFNVKNTGKTAGKSVAQIYVSPVGGGWEAPKRLGAFKKVELAPGESKAVTVTIDPRLLATWQSDSQSWKIADGDYKVMLATSAADTVGTTSVHLSAETLNQAGEIKLK